MNSSQVLLAKSIFHALIKDIDLEDTYHGEKVFMRVVLENLPERLANCALSLLACRQLIRRIHHRQAEFGIVIWIYNLLS